MGSSKQPKFLIDCDPGVDDALAIMMALTSNVDVKAVTCVAGNCNVEQGIANTYKVLKVCNRTEIPLYRGASKSILGRVGDASYFHGADGLGDISKPITSLQEHIPCLQQKHASLAMIDIANKYPGEVTLVALGPLTNLALAIRMDPKFGNKLKGVVIMGGNIRGEGNHTPGAEFNFSQDPEAANITLTEIGCDIKILPWDTCMKSGLAWDWFEGLREEPSGNGKFIKAISRYDLKRRDEGEPSYITCDPIAMAVAIDLGVATEVVKEYCCVELQGELTRGQMVVDWNQLLKKKPNVEIVTEIDKKKFMQKLKEIVA